MSIIVVCGTHGSLQQLYYTQFCLHQGHLLEAVFNNGIPKEPSFHINSFAMQSHPQGVPAARAPAKASTQEVAPSTEPALPYIHKYMPCN